MSITRNGVSSISGTASLTPTILITYAVAAGDLLIVTLVFYSTVPTVSIADTSGNTYVQAGSYQRDANSPSTSCVFYCLSAHAASANTNTVTVTFSAATVASNIAILGYSSAGTAWSLDQTAGNVGTTGNPATGSFTTTSPNEALVCACYCDNGFSAVGSGWTQQFLSGDILAITEDQIATGTGSFNGQVTQLGGSGQWSAAAASFAATASGPTSLRQINDPWASDVFTTTNATPNHSVALDFVVPSGASGMVTVTAVGRNTTTGVGGAVETAALFYNAAGSLTVTQVGSPIVSLVSALGISVSIAASGTTVQCTFTGVVATNIEWLVDAQYRVD